MIPEPAGRLALSRPKIQDTSELDYDSTHIFLKPKKSLATLREWNKPHVSAKIELALPKIPHITSKPAAPLCLQILFYSGLLIFLDIIKMSINISYVHLITLLVSIVFDQKSNI